MGHQERSDIDERIESFIRNLSKPLPPVDPNWQYATAWEKRSETSRLMLRICAIMSSAGHKDAATVAEKIREAIALLQQAEKSLVTNKQAMFVTKMTTDNWGRNKNQEITKEPNNWAEIESAIKDLDGNQRTLVTLKTDDEISMNVGGGDTVYVVYVTSDNKTFQYLVDPVLSNTKRKRLEIGGEEADYTLNCCVNLDMALKAAKTFVEFGQMDEFFVWESETDND